MGSTIGYVPYVVQPTMSAGQLAKLPHIVQFPPAISDMRPMWPMPTIRANHTALCDVLNKFSQTDTHIILIGQIRQHVARGGFVVGFVGSHAVMFARHVNQLNVILVDTLDSCGIFDIRGTAMYYIGSLFCVTNTTHTTLYTVSIANNRAAFKPVACVPAIADLEQQYIMQFDPQVQFSVRA